MEQSAKSLSRKYRKISRKLGLYFPESGIFHVSYEGHTVKPEKLSQFNPDDMFIEMGPDRQSGIYQKNRRG